MYEQLGLVIVILNGTNEKAKKVDEAFQDALEPILQSCKTKDEKLSKIFQARYAKVSRNHSFKKKSTRHYRQRLYCQTKGGHLREYSMEMRQKVGCIDFAAVISRPNIALVASILSEHLRSPSSKHLLSLLPPLNKRPYNYIPGLYSVSLVLISRWFGSNEYILLDCFGVCSKSSFMFSQLHDNIFVIVDLC